MAPTSRLHHACAESSCRALAAQEVTRATQEMIRATQEVVWAAVPAADQVVRILILRPEEIPSILRLGFRAGDYNNRSFGVGMTLSYAMAFHSRVGGEASWESTPLIRVSLDSNASQRHFLPGADASRAVVGN